MRAWCPVSWPWSHAGLRWRPSLGKTAFDGLDMRRDSIFRIASMTKPMTATAVMMLIEEGRVRLDGPVDRLVPELVNRKVLRRIDGALDDTVRAKRSITVEDLLTFRVSAARSCSWPLAGDGHLLRARSQGRTVLCVCERTVEVVRLARIMSTFVDQSQFLGCRLRRTTATTVDAYLDTCCAA
jgi:hypothetical protein